MSAGAAQTKPTFQPVRLKILPAEPIFTVRSRMPGSAISGRVAAPVEDDVLPDLVAERDRVVADAELGEQREVLVGEDRGGRVERVVEERDLGPRREGARQRLLGEAESGRLQRHEARHAAGPAHQRQVGVVHRLEQHDLVAGLDQAR